MVSGAEQPVGPGAEQPVRRAAVLGSPIAHSISPALHRAAYRQLGLSGWRYDRVEMTGTGLAGWLRGLGPGWVGLSLTMPCKEAAIEVADEVSPLAARIGAANTLLRDGDGWWRAENTDVAGVRDTLVAAGHGTAAPAVLIGSGATARAVLAALHELGVRSVALVVRSRPRQQTLDLARALQIRIDVLTEVDAVPTLAAASLVVSTVPDASALAATLAAHWSVHPPGRDELAAPDVRTAGQPTTAIEPPATVDVPVPGAARAAVDDPTQPPPPMLFDVVYAGWPTPLARVVRAAGGQAVGGLELLVRQGGEQVRLMTGLTPELAVMRAAGRVALGLRSPID